LEEQLQQPTLEKLTDASATRTRKHPPGILCKAWPDVCPRYRSIPTQSPVYVPKRGWQLGCQRANNHQAGTVESWVDHNEQGIKPKTCQGYRKKMVQKITEDLERIQDPRSLWKMQMTESQNKPSICVLHYDWSSFGGVISATFPHATSCLSPVLEGGPG
jgi:hypothetical protein